MIQLRSELLIDVFRLACVDGLHGVEQRLQLAQVCAYWRAVALDYPAFWAHIVVRTSRDAALLPISLARSGDGPLDVELYSHSQGHERTLSSSDERAVVDSLMAPNQRLRLKRLFIRTSASDPLLAVLSSGLDFPALQDLEIRSRNFDTLYSLAPRLEAPTLRRLALSRFELLSWNSFFTPSLEHLYLDVYVEGVPWKQLLTIILYQCTALHSLEYGVRGASFEMPTIVYKTQRLRAGVPFSDILRFINRVAVDPLPDIAVTIVSGEAKYAPLVDLFSGMGALLDLHYDEIDEEIVIRDDVGRIRRLISFNNDYHWGMNDLWCTLARLYTID